MNVTELQPEHLEAAAELVAARYRTLRSQAPSLPAKYEDADTIWRLLDERIGMPGVAAWEGGRLIGFLTGFVISDFYGKRAFYSPEWANGADPGNSRPIYEEMYRAASPRWIAAGCAIHAVTLTAHDRTAIETWQWLNFGLCSVDGVRDLAPVPGGPGNLRIQQAGLRDVAEVTAFGRALEQHMAAPPVFLLHEAENYGEWLQQPDHAAWLAYDDQEAVGCLGMELAHASGCDIVQDQDTAGIIMAYTRQNSRGQGIGTALVNQALEWARLQGCQRCAVDWEPMNPPANRFWTRWFNPVCYSLMRWIDERLVGGAG